MKIQKNIMVWGTVNHEGVSIPFLEFKQEERGNITITPKMTEAVQVSPAELYDLGLALQDLYIETAD